MSAPKSAPQPYQSSSQPCNRRTGIHRAATDRVARGIINRDLAEARRILNVSARPWRDWCEREQR
jgi:hypothetical protein